MRPTAPKDAAPMAQKWREEICYLILWNRERTTMLWSNHPPIRNLLHEPPSHPRNRFRNPLILFGKLTAHDSLRW
jgi:hypothetical protein